MEGGGQADPPLPVIGICIYYIGGKIKTKMYVSNRLCCKCDSNVDIRHRIGWKHRVAGNISVSMSEKIKDENVYFKLIVFEVL